MDAYTNDIVIGELMENIETEKTCIICGKTFFSSELKSKMDAEKYCSKECFGKAHRILFSKISIGDCSNGRIKKNCVTCGKEFTVKISDLIGINRKYCSKECYYYEIQHIIVKYKCRICGKEFYRTPSQTKRLGKKYCSKECFNTSVATGGTNNSQKIKCICLACGKEFFCSIYRMKSGKGKYCSKKCYTKMQQSTRKRCICKECGKEFFTKHSVITYGKGIFCSSKCQHKYLSGVNSSNWNGGSSFVPYCYKFNKRRKEAVRDFFGRKCLVCGSDETEFKTKLPVHHIDHDKEQGCSGKPFNLVPLCPSCHSKEGHDVEKYQKYINKTLEDGFLWGIWNRKEYEEKVMYNE